MIGPDRGRGKPAECDLRLIPQRLARFQRVRDAFLSFLFPAKGNESFALEIQNILLAHELRRGQRPTRQNVS